MTDCAEFQSVVAPRRGPDAAELARRMGALKEAAREKGYFKVPLSDQIYHVLEMVAPPVVAFYFLSCGGFLTLLGIPILSLSILRTAYLAHDLAHGQWGPRNGPKAKLLLAIIAFFQGFGSIWWIEKHELHHSFPNGCKKAEDGTLVPIDGDLDSPPWVVWDKLLAKFNENARQTGIGAALAWLLPRWQVPLFFPFLSIARFNWSYQSVEIAFKRKDYLEGVLCIAHWIVGFGLAAYLSPGPVWIGLLWMLVIELSCGLMLAGFFVLSHTGMEVYDAAKAKGFYDRQARSTRNTPGNRFNSWMAGGLNHQIEHHMFPTMARCRLNGMRGPVRQAMLDCGYEYVDVTNLQAMQEVLRALSEAARA